MLLFFILFILMIIYPETIHSGTKNGLILLENQVIPSLYPFIFVTSALKEYYKEKTSPILLIIGLLCGYPIGAKIVASHSFDSIPISSQNLLVLCNMPSPAYMLGFIGFQCLNQPKLGLLLYTCTLIGNLLTIFLFSVLNISAPNAILLCSIRTASEHTISWNSVISETFTTLKNITTYLLIFNVIAAYIKNLKNIPLLFKLILIGLCEMTTAVSSISSYNLSLQWKLVLITGIVSFGGLSVIAQTASVIQGTNLSIKKYMTDKAISSFIAMSVMYGFTLILI